METMEQIKIGHELTSKERHLLTILELLYNSLRNNEHLNDAFILYKDLKDKEPEAIAKMKKDEVIKKAMNLTDDQKKYKTYLAEFISEGKPDFKKLDNDCKAVFVNWYFKPFADIMDKQMFINSTKHIFIFNTQKP